MANAQMQKQQVYCRIFFSFIAFIVHLESNQLLQHLRTHLFPIEKTELVIYNNAVFQLLMSAFSSEQLTKVRCQIICRLLFSI